MSKKKHRFIWKKGEIKISRKKSESRDRARKKQKSKGELSIKLND